MKTILIGLLMVMVVSGAYGQQAPTTAPVGQRPAAGARRGPGFMTEAQFEAAQQWASQNMPDLARFVVEYGRGQGAVPMTALIRSRMMAIEQGGGDPMFRERVRRNMATENQIGQYLVEMQTATPQRREELKRLSETAMRENVEGFMNERQERIDRLKARLEIEQRQLDQERRTVDQVVSRRLMPFRMALQGANAAPPPAAEPVIAAPPQGQ